MISIIILAQAGVESVAECLHSVIAQSSGDWEVLVAAAPQLSFSALQEKIGFRAEEKTNFRFFTVEEENGARIRNAAMKKTSGEYVLFLSGHERLSGDFLAEMAKAAEQEVFDVIYSERISLAGEPLPCELPDRRNIVERRPAFFGALFSRKMYDACGGFDENAPAGYADWDFWMQLIRNKAEFLMLRKPLLQTDFRSNESRMPEKVQAFFAQKYADIFQDHSRSFLPFGRAVSLLIRRPFLPEAKYRAKLAKYQRAEREFRNPENPRVIMTLLVKNEADILEENLIFHKAMGVDGFIVTDNISTDGTLAIIDKYVKKGWILRAISEPSQNYTQSDWVHRMAVIARSRFAADWIINADADEFWYSASGRIKDGLPAQNNKLFVPVYNMLSVSPDWKDYTQKIMRGFPPDAVQRLVAANRLSKFSQFTVSFPKVIARACDYKMIYMGNHDCDVLYNMPKEISRDLCIYHYNVRGESHYCQKILVGGAAFERSNAPKNICQHWRELYQGYKNGTANLHEEYLKSNGTFLQEEIAEYQLTETDTTIRDFFARRTADK